VSAGAAAAGAAAGADTAGFAVSANTGALTMTPVAPIAIAIALPAISRFIQVNIFNLSLKCRRAGFTGTNTNNMLNRGYKNFPVANLASFSGLLNRLNGFF